MKIMFICTGNICRSAMAEAMLKKMAQENNQNLEVYSCGVYAEDGDFSTYTAIEVMQEYGVNLKEHRATNIKNSKIKEMDLILCATQSHKHSVCMLYPELKEKVYTVKEYVGLNNEGQDTDIKDPWGYGLEVYRACATEIEKCLQLLIKKIK